MLLPLELSRKLCILIFFSRHVDLRHVMSTYSSTRENVQCDKLATVIGRTKLTVLATVDV